MNQEYDVTPNDFLQVSADYERSAIGPAGRRFEGLHQQHSNHPILGLATKQRRRYNEVKLQVSKVRALQETIFLNQFRQFPDSSSYEKIWSNFQAKDDSVNDLIKHLGALCVATDTISIGNGVGNNTSTSTTTSTNGGSSSSSSTNASNTATNGTGVNSK